MSFKYGFQSEQDIIVFVWMYVSAYIVFLESTLVSGSYAIEIKFALLYCEYEYDCIELNLMIAAFN